MENQLIMWIIGALFSLVSVLFAAQMKKVDSRLDCLETKVQDCQLEIAKLKEKLWSKEDLEQSVEEAVERVFLRWENNQLKQNSRNG